MDDYQVVFITIDIVCTDSLTNILFTQSAQQAVRKLGGLAYKGKRLKVELSNS